MDSSTQVIQGRLKEENLRDSVVNFPNMLLHHSPLLASTTFSPRCPLAFYCSSKKTHVYAFVVLKRSPFLLEAFTGFLSPVSLVLVPHSHTCTPIALWQMNWVVHQHPLSLPYSQNLGWAHSHRTWFRDGHTVNSSVSAENVVVTL